MNSLVKIRMVTSFESKSPPHNMIRHQEPVLVRDSKVMVLRPSELNSRQREAWSRFVQADPALASPFFALEYAESISQSISEVQGEKPQGFRALRRTIMNLGHRRRVDG